MTRHEQQSRRQGAFLLAAGLLLLAGVPLTWWLTAPAPAGQTVTSVNADAAVALADRPVDVPTDASAEAATTQSPEPVGSSSGAPAPAPVSESGTEPTASAEPSPADQSTPAAPDPPPAAQPTVPVRIVIPDLGVDTSVVSVGVADDGELEIPDDVDTVGWYRFGALPGATGSAVLTGHVDSADQGKGAFAQLGDLDPGEQFALVDEAGGQRWFTVVAREQWPKDEVPMSRLFDPAGEPRVVLMTCGGAFDPAVRGYKDNIAVTATPVN